MAKQNGKSATSPDVREKLLDHVFRWKRKAFIDGIEESEIRQLLCKHTKAKSSPPGKLSNNWRRLMFFALVCLAVGLVANNLFVSDEGKFDMEYFWFNIDSIYGSNCIIDNNPIVMEVARPVTKCSMCRDIDTVPIVYNLTQQDFKELYAYNGRPALVRGMMKHWPAMESFNFNFLKALYTDTKGAFDTQEEECQYFPYNCDLYTLEMLFNMSDDRAALQNGEKTWYVGWSNCHPKIADSLREQYKRPSFLPSDSESSNMDWIFMGWSGEGANMHLDYVQRPSWQAQISGRKTWFLVPAPECENICRPLNVTVEKGDIILIDTNQWYHSTFIHPGEISITIGSEYD